MQMKNIFVKKSRKIKVTKGFEWKSIPKVGRKFEKCFDMFFTNLCHKNVNVKPSNCFQKLLLSNILVGISLGRKHLA